MSTKQCFAKKFVSSMETSDEEMGTCRCCLLVGSLKDLWSEHSWMGAREVYGTMLAECFAISLHQKLNETKQQICETCIKRLRDAYNFRQQVINSQVKLEDAYFDEADKSEVQKESDYQGVEYLEETENEGNKSEMENVESDLESSQDEDKELDEDVKEELTNSRPYSDEFIQSPSEDIDEEVATDCKKSKKIFKQYTMGQLKKAIYLVKSGEMNVSEASVLHNVPRQTLSLRLKKELGKRYKEIISKWKVTHSKCRKYKDGVNVFVKADYETDVVKHPLNAEDTVKMKLESVGQDGICDVKNDRGLQNSEEKTNTSTEYTNVMSKWKLVNSTKEKAKRRDRRNRLYRDYSREEFDEAIEDIKAGKLALFSADRDRGIPTSTLARHLKKELGSKYRETIFQWRRQQQAIGEPRVKKSFTNEDPNFKVVKFVKRKRIPTKDTLIKAVNAVKCGKMNVSGACKIFHIPEKVLKRLMSSDEDIVNKSIDDIIDRRKNRTYPMDVLRHCTRLVQEGKLTRNEASYMFNLPSSAIHYRLQKGFLEDGPTIERHKVKRNGVHVVELDNSITYSRDDTFSREQRLKLECDVKDVLTYTNATPFLVFRRQLICAYCASEFKDPEELREHTGTHSEERLTKVEDMLRPAEEKELMRLDITNLQCDVCCVAIESWSAMFGHLQEKHDVIVEEGERNRMIPFRLVRHKFNCVLCDERAANQTLLEYHMNKHYGNYICDECGESFMSLNRLKIHTYQKGTLKRLYECKLCDETFIGRVPYLEHSQVVHKVALRCPCNFCTQRFNNRYQRHLHMLEVHKEEYKVEVIVCQECGKTFQWKPFYVSHFKSKHLNERNHKCEYCEKTFFMKNQLKKHLTTHTGEKNFVCIICSRRFSRFHHVKAHMKVHVDRLDDNDGLREIGEAGNINK